MAKADIRFEADGAGGGTVRIRLNDESARGRKARLSLHFKAHVKDSRPVHANRPLFQQELTLDRSELEVPIPPGRLKGLYSYTGDKLELRPTLQLVIDYGVLFDSEVESTIALGLGDRPRIASHDGKLMEPKDAFDFFANLGAIPHTNRMITLGLTVVGGLVIVANALLGVHDQFVPEAQALFYDHSGDDGSESPLMKALIGSGVVGAGIWATIKYQLRKYMSFALKPHPPLRRGLRLAARDLVEGKARVDLEDVTVRVVACNRECGQYKRGSGTKERTVSFKTPSRAVLLYERYLALVPANAPLSMYLEGEVEFDLMFADLYPPLLIGSDHGIDVAWEVQLLHPKFVDHEADGCTAELRYEDFLDG